jgi:hypothetical protein
MEPFYLWASLKTTHGCKIPQQCTNSSALAFVSSNPIHTALPQPSSSPVILNNTHKTNSHLLHKNIKILAAKAPKTVKPSRQEHPKTSSSSSCASSSLRHKRVKC